MSALPAQTWLGPVVEVSVEAGAWPALEDMRQLAENAVRAVSGATGDGVPAECEISVLLTDNAAIRTLNRTWRGKDKPTNVLSFPQPSGPLLGDIVLAAETVQDEADLAGKPVEAHIAHLMVHGLLHLLGYDHETEVEAEEMEQLEAAALAEMGVADPYRPSQQGS
jgi:probable rRNA maturation factor